MRLIRLLMNRRLQAILFFAWFLVIMILSVIPDYTPDYVNLDHNRFRIDYYKHFSVFLPLGFLLISMRQLRIVLLVLLSVIVVSVPETVQYFLPYRTFNPMDLVSNCIGFITGIFLMVYFDRKFAER